MPLRRLNNKVRITSLVLAILGSALFGYALLNGSLTSREAALKSGETATLNIATSLSTQVNLSFRAADLLIQQIAELEGNRSLPPAELQRLLQDLLTRQSRLFPELDSLLVIDDQGRILHRWPSQPAPTALPGMAPAAAMARMQAGPEGRSSNLLIGPPSSAA